MTNKKTNKDPVALKLLRFIFKTLTPVAPGLMNRFAYNLWLTPTRFKMSTREKAAANMADASFIVVNGLKIRVWSWGQGPTVLFIHGWSGRGTQISSFVYPLNQAGFKVMSFDLPAHGHSEGKRTNAFDISQSISEVIKRIDNLHSVITHSFAGLIFGYYYHPEIPLKNGVMICPPATLDTAFKQFTESLELPQSVETYVLQTLKHDFGDDVFEKLSLITNVTKITQPILVVHDKEDDIVPIESGKQIANALPHGTMYETSDLGHHKILHDKTVIDRVLQHIRAN